MDLTLSDDQKLLQKTVREFAESEVKPLAKELDETGHFPRETFKKAAELQTRAVKKSDTYVLNGTKAWITNGGAADAAIVYVNTDPPKGEKGITALVVEKGTPGFKVGKEEKKLGISATACSELIFTDCVVPVANRIGSEGEGYKVALSTLDGGRIGIAAQATGIAQGAFEAG